MSDRAAVWVCAAAWCVGLALYAAAQERTEERWTETDWGRHLAERMSGEAEVVMADLSRADIVTDTTAYEVEWSDKKGESVYQALSYMLEANKDQAGIILLCRGDYHKDRLQLARVVAYLQGKGVPIHMETIKADSRPRGE